MDESLQRHHRLSAMVLLPQWRYRHSALRDVLLLAASMDASPEDFSPCTQSTSLQHSPNGLHFVLISPSRGTASIPVLPCSSHACTYSLFDALCRSYPVHRIRPCQPQRRGDLQKRLATTTHHRIESPRCSS